MADRLADVHRIISSENGIVAIEVDNRYLIGTHPDQEAIEAEARAANLKLAYHLGKRARQRWEQMFFDVITR